MVHNARGCDVENFAQEELCEARANAPACSRGSENNIPQSPRRLEQHITILVLTANIEPHNDVMPG